MEKFIREWRKFGVKARVTYAARLQVNFVMAAFVSDGFAFNFKDDD